MQLQYATNDQSINQSINRSIVDQSNNQTIKQSINQSIDHSNNQSIVDQSINRSDEHMTRTWSSRCREWWAPSCDRSCVNVRPVPSRRGIRWPRDASQVEPPGWNGSLWSHENMTWKRTETWRSNELKIKLRLEYTTQNHLKSNWTIVN